MKPDDVGKHFTMTPYKCNIYICTIIVPLADKLNMHFLIDHSGLDKSSITSILTTSSFTVLVLRVHIIVDASESYILNDISNL